jgi:hypothetical protein
MTAVVDEVATLRERLVERDRELLDLRQKVRDLEAQINTPEIADFVKAVQLEAAHQRARWGSDHDAGKTDADWFWLIGYLAGKAMHNPGEYPACHVHEDLFSKEPLYYTPGTCPVTGCPDSLRTPPAEKQLHRIITVAAAAANWHAQKLGASNMRPGILPPKGEENA